MKEMWVFVMPIGCKVPHFFVVKLREEKQVAAMKTYTNVPYADLRQNRTLQG